MCHRSAHLSLLNKKLLFRFSGFPGRTSCLDTGVPTRVSNRTSVKCARRSSPAVTTCPNTSKFTAFRESAGQFALQTDARLGSLGITGNTGLLLIQTQEQDECTGVCAKFAPSSSQSEYVSGSAPYLFFQQTVIVLIYCTKVNQHSYHPVNS